MLIKIRGFTLIELLIVVAIIGILSAIAYPSYKNSMYKSRRADAVTKLLEVHLAQERYRANNVIYATLTQLGAPFNSLKTEKEYYNLTEIAATATAYQVTATINTTGRQNGDTCTSFIVTHNGPTLTTVAEKACWGQ